jgi:hypothetical protein
MLLRWTFLSFLVCLELVRASIYPELDKSVLKNLADWVIAHGGKVTKVKWPVSRKGTRPGGSSL